jgi:4-aminobutyrate aminotransferase-like enzyme
MPNFGLITTLKGLLVSTGGLEPKPDHSGAAGIDITQRHGNLYFDSLAGAATLALGNNHPIVLDAISNALKANLPLHTLDLTTPVKK